MPYTIEFVASAQKELARLQPTIRRRVAARIAGLADEPRPHGAALLSGQAERIWRLREGAFRIVYQIDDDRLIVLVVRIGDRRDVYRGM